MLLITVYLEALRIAAKAAKQIKEKRREMGVSLLAFITGNDQRVSGP